jgi:hypothetical protein
VHPANACGVQSRCSGTAVQIAGLARRNLSPCFARAAVHHPRYQFDRMLLPVRESLIGGRHTSRRPRLLVVPDLVDCCSLLQTVVGLRCITAVGAAPIMARHAVKQCERAAFMHSRRSARLTAAAHNSSGRRTRSFQIQSSSAPPIHLIAASAWPESEPEPVHLGLTEPGVHVRSRALPLPLPSLRLFPESYYCNLTSITSLVLRCSLLPHC